MVDQSKLAVHAAGVHGDGRGEGTATILASSSSGGGPPLPSPPGPPNPTRGATDAAESSISMQIQGAIHTLVSVFNSPGGLSTPGVSPLGAFQPVQPNTHDIKGGMPHHHGLSSDASTDSPRSSTVNMSIRANSSVGPARSQASALFAPDKGSRHHCCSASCSCSFTLMSSTVKPKLDVSGLCAGTIMVECALSESQQSAASSEWRRWEEVPALLVVTQHSVFIAQVVLPAHAIGFGNVSNSGTATGHADITGSVLADTGGLSSPAGLQSHEEAAMHPANLILYSFPIPSCDLCLKSEQITNQVIACSKSGATNVLRSFQLPNLHEALRSRACGIRAGSPAAARRDAMRSDTESQMPNGSSSYVSDDVLIAGWLHKWPMRSQYLGSRTRRFFALMAPAASPPRPSILLYWKTPPQGFLIANESTLATCENGVEIRASTCRGSFALSSKCSISRRKSSLYGENLIVLSNDVDELEIACFSESEDAMWYRALCELLFVERSSRHMKLFSKVTFMCGTYDRVKTTNANGKMRAEKRKGQTIGHSNKKKNESPSNRSTSRESPNFPVFTDPPVTIFDPTFLQVREASNATTPGPMLNLNGLMKSTQIIVRDICGTVSSSSPSECFARVELSKSNISGKQQIMIANDNSNRGGPLKTIGDNFSASVDSSSELTVATTMVDEGSTVASTSDRTNAFQFRRHIDTFGNGKLMPAVSVDSSVETFDLNRSEERLTSLPPNIGGYVKGDIPEVWKSTQSIYSRYKEPVSIKSSECINTSKCRTFCTLFSAEDQESHTKEDIKCKEFYLQISRGDTGQADLHKLVHSGGDDLTKSNIGSELMTVCAETINLEGEEASIACAVFGDNAGAIFVGWAALIEGADVKGDYWNGVRKKKESLIPNLDHCINLNKLSDSPLTEAQAIEATASMGREYLCSKFTDLLRPKASSSESSKYRPFVGHSFDATITTIGMSRIDLLETYIAEHSPCSNVSSSTKCSHSVDNLTFHNRHSCIILLTGDDLGSVVVWKLNILLSTCGSSVDIKWSSEPLQRCDYHGSVQSIKYCPHSEKFVVLTDSQALLYDFCDSNGVHAVVRSDIVRAQASAIIEHSTISKFRSHHLGALDVYSEPGRIRLWRISNPTATSTTSSTTGLRSHILFSEFSISDLELHQAKLLESVSKRLFDAATLISSSINADLNIQNRLEGSIVGFESLICSVASGFGIERLHSRLFTSIFNHIDSSENREATCPPMTMDKWSFTDFEEYVRLRNRIRKWWKENSSRVLILHEKVRLHCVTDSSTASNTNNDLESVSVEFDSKGNSPLGINSSLRTPRKLVIPPSGTCGGLPSPAFTHSLPVRDNNLQSADVDSGSDYWRYRLAEVAKNIFDPFASFDSTLELMKQELTAKRQIFPSCDRHTTIESISPLFAAAVTKEFCGHIIVKCVLQTVENNPFLQALHAADHSGLHEVNACMLSEELFSLELVCSMISQLCEGFGFDYVEALKLTTQNDIVERLHGSIEEYITNFYGSSKKDDSLGSIFVDILGWGIEEAVDFMNGFTLGMLEAPTEGIAALVDIRQKLISALENLEYSGINSRVELHANLFIRWIDNILDTVGICRDDASGLISPIHAEILLLPLVIHSSFIAYAKKIATTVSSAASTAKLGSRIRDITMKLLNTFIVKPLRHIERPIAQDTPLSLIFALSGFDHTQSPALIKLVQGQGSVNTLDDFFSKAPGSVKAPELQGALEPPSAPPAPYLFEAERNDAGAPCSYPIVPSQLRLISELIQSTQPWVRFVISSRNKVEQKEK